jgi:hypothetical protein
LVAKFKEEMFSLMQKGKLVLLIYCFDVEAVKLKFDACGNNQHK